MYYIYIYIHYKSNRQSSVKPLQEFEQNFLDLRNGSNLMHFIYSTHIAPVI